LQLRQSHVQSDTLGGWRYGLEGWLAAPYTKCIGKRVYDPMSILHINQTLRQSIIKSQLAYMHMNNRRHKHRPPPVSTMVVLCVPCANNISEPSRKQSYVQPYVHVQPSCSAPKRACRSTSTPISTYCTAPHTLGNWRLVISCAARSCKH